MNETPADRQSQCFLGLLQSLVTSAWIQLGKQKNFMTQTTAVNLEAAAYTIEILEALQARTRGNLTADENRFLEQSLTALRMNFIQVKLHPQPSESTGSGTDHPADSATPDE